MKKLIKCLISQELYGEEKIFVEMYVKNGIYTVQYKNATKNECKVISKTNDIMHAELDFIRYAIFIL